MPGNLRGVTIQYLAHRIQQPFTKLRIGGFNKKDWLVKLVLIGQKIRDNLDS